MKMNHEDIQRLESLIEECGDLIEGAFYKHSMVHATIELRVTDKFLAELEEGGHEKDHVVLAPFRGKRLSIDGTQDYQNGWERGYGSIKILQLKEVFIPAVRQITWEEVDKIEEE